MDLTAFAVCPLTFLCRILALGFLGMGLSSQTFPRSAARGSNNEQRKSNSGSEDISTTIHDWLCAIKSHHCFPCSGDKVTAAMDVTHKETTFFAHSNQHQQSLYMIALPSFEAKHYILRMISMGACFLLQCPSIEYCLCSLISPIKINGQSNQIRS